MNDKTIIEVKNLKKVFNKGQNKVVAIENISMSINVGEFVTLMGPSGSGKSTLLNILAGIDTPSDGKVIIDNNDMSNLKGSKLSNWRNRTIGFVFQMFNLLPALTAYENVELPLLLLPLTPRKRRDHVLAALEAVKLSDRIKHYPRQLSGGQEQRVAIARAIVTDPKIILADEPTGDLDKENASAIVDLVKALNMEFNKTFVVVSHDKEVALQSKRIITLQKGGIITSA